VTTFADALWHDLDVAITKHLEESARRRRARRVGAMSALAVGVLASGAIASGIASDLNLAPGDWAVLRTGQVDEGRGAYVHATRRADGTSSTFMVEHDAGLTPYEAFLLHEQTLAAANATSPVPVRQEPGALCTPEQLTQAERLAVDVLSSLFQPGAAFEATGPAVSRALTDAFASAPCRGLEYAGEQARLVFAGKQPASKLMSGVR
jgi:hypothetical protein